MARPSLDVYKDYCRIIQEGNYILGRGHGSGYGSAGYGQQIEGSMTFQGLLPYYSDVVNRTGVEVHRCKFNQMAGNPRESIGAQFPRPTPLEPDLLECSEMANVETAGTAVMMFNARLGRWKKCEVPILHFAQRSHGTVLMLLTDGTIHS